MKPWLAVLMAAIFLTAAPAVEMKRVNVARTATAAADAPFTLQRQPVAGKYTPEMAIDGVRSAASRWVSEQSRKPHYLELTLPAAQELSEAIIYPDYPAGTYGRDFCLQYERDGQWHDVAAPEVAAETGVIRVRFAPVVAAKFRYHARTGDRDAYVKLFEFELYARVPDDGKVPMSYRETSDMLKTLPRLQTLALGENWTLSDSAETPGVPVRVGIGLDKQPGKFPLRGEVFYHCDFDLPETFSGHSLLLELGKISVDDEVRVNGVRLGGCGKFEPPYQVVPGSSGIERRYLAPCGKSPFRSGRNHLTVRVNLGFLKGMYEGLPALSAIPEKLPVVELDCKRPGRCGLWTMIGDREHLNQFDAGQPFGLAPRVTASVGDFTGALKVAVDGRALADMPVAAVAGQWLNLPVVPLGGTPPGRHDCELDLQQDGRSVWRQRIDFTVRATAYAPAMPVDGAIPAVPPTGNNDMAAIASGSFGPRFQSGDTLDNTVVAGDGRGSLSFTVLCENPSEGPLLYSTNLKPTPLSPYAVGKYLKADGKYYDGIDNIWSWGFLSDGSGENAAAAVTASSWYGKSWHFTYPSGQTLDFRITSLSPAWELTSDSRRIGLFEHLGRWGLGAPQAMAWEENGRIGIGRRVEGRAMSANWLLVWFHGAENWEEFDSPWLIVLENRPELVELAGDGVTLHYPGKAGNLRGMPLFGVELLDNGRTAGWKERIPDDVVALCRYWSGALLDAPRAVSRAFAVDFASDRVLIHDRFQYAPLEDAWKTPPRRFAPVPPVYPLAAGSGNLKLAVNAPARDVRFATLHGPLMVIEGSDEARYSIDGLLRLVREARQVAPGGDSPYREELEALVLQHMDELKQHPWPMLTSHNRFIIPGAYQPEVSDLLLALPYLSPETAAALRKEIGIEMERYLMASGIPGKEFEGKVRPDLFQQPLLWYFRHPVTGRELPGSVKLPNYPGAGIDKPCWESLQLALLWHYDTATGGSLADRNWAAAVKIFNVIANGHDWATAIVWDSYSGIRVGNGLQEGPIIHAGCAAMARMAARRGDTALRDLASYLAVSQLIGVQASLAANDYLRSRRPFSASHTQAADMIFTEKSRRRHYVEFNEFAGFSPNVIMPRGLLNHPNSFIMTTLPEIMRPYREVWADGTGEFFFPDYDCPDFDVANGTVKLDMLVYMANRRDPEYLARALEWRRNAPWMQRLADLRAILDAAGKIEYRKLW